MLSRPKTNSFKASRPIADRFPWSTLVVATLAFWLSGSFVLDFVIMPCLYWTGMMVEPGFATAGYSIFGVFNHLEVMCAAIALTGLLVLRITQSANFGGRRGVFLGMVVLAIALIDTYTLAPTMSALGLNLNAFGTTEVPALMNQMHVEYWALELVKLFSIAVLIRFCLTSADQKG
ncbi:MAG: hypothetical protein MUF49_19705 [Oculatellaceae cyanobacterium Prado106]|nr:hypothetical protein [Oculatellaceae cyanobacterium Prado106]